MAVYPLFGLNQQGKSSTVTSQRHLNLYAEIQRDAEKAKVVYYGTPGLELFSDANGDTPIRGWTKFENLIYFVHLDTLYEMNNAGTRTSRGTLSTSSGRVGMVHDGTRIVIVDGTAGYTYAFATTTFATISDAQFPNGANTVDWLDGQFIVDAGDGDDTFYISPDGSAWDALDFATAESNPDGLVRVLVNSDELVLAGAQTIEFWGNTGNADFPFAPVKGATQAFGLAARWSLCSFNSGLAGLFTREEGQVQVMFVSGYVPRPISSPELDHIINHEYTTTSDATAFSYMLGGHPMLQLNFPTEGASWLFDALSGLWSPLEYGLNAERHRAEMQLYFLGRTLVSDYENGNVYVLDPDTYTDNGEAIAREIIGRHVFKEDNVVVSRLVVDMETGVGLPSGQGSNPQAQLYISKDNGHTWGAGLWASMGAMGKYMTRVAWRRLGAARDWLFKVRITDPVKVVITYAAIEASQ